MCKSLPLIFPLKSVGCSGCQAGSCGAKWMAESQRSTLLFQTKGERGGKKGGREEGREGGGRRGWKEGRRKGVKEEGREGGSKGRKGVIKGGR